MGRKQSEATKEKIRKSLTKPPHKKICPKCKNEFETKKKNQIHCSKKCSNPGWKNVHNNITSEQWSKINKKSYKEGKNYVSGGTTKWYNYKDIKVQGTYELKACKILDKWKETRKIKDWEYTSDKISYIGVDNKKHTYLLDFKVFENDGSFYYLETKGYKRPNDELKWQAVKDKGYKLVVWFEKDIAGSTPVAPASLLVI